jgi:hypothetical protein
MVNDAYTALDYVDDTSGTPLFSRFFGSPRVRPLFRQSLDWNAGGYLPLLWVMEPDRMKCKPGAQASDAPAKRYSLALRARLRRIFIKVNSFRDHA